MATVAKPFNTITQRFKLGADVSEADDLAPFSFADMKARGFISDAVDASPAPSSFGKRAVAPSDSAAE